MRTSKVTVIPILQYVLHERVHRWCFCQSVILRLFMPPQNTTTESDRSDEDLVVAYRNGDATCFKTLLERYVFQESFLQVHLSADSFDAERRFKPWLYTIAANKGRDFLRRQNRRAATSLSSPLSKDGDGTFGDLIAGDSPMPSAPLEGQDERNTVSRVVDSLSAHYREILVLAYFQKMSYEQIAKTLEIPLGTVKSRLHAAVASFSDAYNRADTKAVTK